MDSSFITLITAITALIGAASPIVVSLIQAKKNKSETTSGIYIPTSYSLNRPKSPRLWLIVVSFSILGGVIGYSGASSLKPRLTFDGYLNAGKQCMEIKDYDCALENFNSAIKVSPENPMGYWWRGFLYYSDKNIDPSIEDFKKSASLSPGNSNTLAFYYLGRIYSSEKGKYLESIDYFSEAINRNSSFDDAYCGRANAYRNLNRKDDAMKDYQECLKIATENNDEFYINFANEGLSWATK